VYLRIGRTVELVDPADTTKFHVSCPSTLSDQALRQIVKKEDVGELLPDDTGHMMVRIDAVRRLAAGRVGPTWADDLTGMLAYAERKGWLSGDGTGIRAHLVRDDH
jgi:hypothetical protein